MTTIHRSPWRMALPLLAVIALLAIWSIYWYVAIGYAQATAEQERAKAAQRGLSLTCATENWGGYPFRFEFTCSKPHITLRDKTTLDASHLMAVAQAYVPWKAVLLLDGPTTVTPSRGEAVTATHQRIITSVNANSPTEPVVISDIRDLKIDTRLSAKTVLLSYRKRNGGLQDAAINAADVTLVPPGQPPLTIKAMAADASLATDDHATLRSATATVGSLTIAAKGAGSLDAQHRPEGQLATTISDPTALGKLAANYVTLTPDQQNGLTAALALMGGKATFTAKNGQLMLGPLPIASLKPLY